MQSLSGGNELFFASGLDEKADKTSLLGTSAVLIYLKIIPLILYFIRPIGSNIKQRYS